MVRMPSKLRLLVCLPLDFLTGCSSGGQAATCVSGASVACVCPTGQQGAQVCTGEGTFGACLCATPGADSGGLGSDGGGGAQDTTAAGVMVTTFAGSAMAPHGSADGVGAAARFYFPTGLAVNAAGDIFVADTNNNIIRKITPTGVVTTLSGSAGQNGSADGKGAVARFFLPTGLALDRAGNIFVADSSNNTIRKVTPTGEVTTLAGAVGAFGNSDGVGADARFDTPSGVEVDGAGDILVADQNNGTIRQITPAGVVTTFAGTAGAFGRADGLRTTATFWGPKDVAVGGAGNVFVSDGYFIRKITPAGVVTTLAGSASVSGNVDGTGTAASFNLAYSVAADAEGNVFVADTVNNTIRKITPAGVVTTLAGSLVTRPAGPTGQAGSADGTGASASFNNPMGIAVDGAGNIFVADTFNNTIRKLTPAGK